jgi:hypothetical protein
VLFWHVRFGHHSIRLLTSLTQQYDVQFEDDSEDSPVKLPPGHMMDADEVKRYEEVGECLLEPIYNFLRLRFKLT